MQKERIFQKRYANDVSNMQSVIASNCGGEADRRKQKLKLVFVPHQSFEQNYRQREHYLVEEMANHIQVHVISWTWADTLHAESLKDFLDIEKVARGLRSWKKENSYTVHHVRRFIYPPIAARTINQALFRYELGTILSQEDPDAILLGPNAEVLGFPRRETRTPIIFDYSDFLHNRRHMRRYCSLAKAITCVSKTLVKDASTLHSNIHYLPNGVDSERFLNGRRRETREKYGIAEGVKVIGLIGVTASPTMFFLDAAKELERRIGDFVYLIVGDGPAAERMKAHSLVRKVPVIFTGWVPFEGIEDLFAAIDVGIYPVDQNLYFDSAFPIKILEYTAARKPVVSTDIHEVRSLGFPNVGLCDPNPRDFAEKVSQALNYNGSYPSLEEFSWKRISRRLEEIVESVKRR